MRLPEEYTCTMRIPAVARAALVLPGLAAAAHGGTVLFAQQQPIFGCHASPSCAPSPTGSSALLDRAATGLLLGASIRWGPGFHFGLVAPLLSSRESRAGTAADARVFHLRGASLLPTPSPTPTPTSPPPDPVPPSGR